MPSDDPLTPAIRHWFCRGGLDLDRILPLGIITEAQILALWAARIDSEREQCKTGGGINVPASRS